MMNDSTTVTMPLNDFDKLREDSDKFSKLVPQIAKCFVYNLEEFDPPKACSKCTKENPDCKKCKAYQKNPPYKESFTVDVERLIKVCKKYALFGKKTELTEAEIEEITVIEKRGTDE